MEGCLWKWVGSYLEGRTPIAFSLWYYYTAAKVAATVYTPGKANESKRRVTRWTFKNMNNALLKNIDLRDMS